MAGGAEGHQRLVISRTPVVDMERLPVTAHPALLRAPVRDSRRSRWPNAARGGKQARERPATVGAFFWLCELIDLLRLSDECGVLGPSLSQHGKLRVCVLPKGKKIPICIPGASLLPGDNVRSAEL